jgi:hypothetical protein
LPSCYQPYCCARWLCLTSSYYSLPSFSSLASCSARRVIRTRVPVEQKALHAGARGGNRRRVLERRCCGYFLPVSACIWLPVLITPPHVQHRCCNALKAFPTFSQTLRVCARNRGRRYWCRQGSGSCMDRSFAQRDSHALAEMYHKCDSRCNQDSAISRPNFPPGMRHQLKHLFLFNVLTADTAIKYRNDCLKKC